MADITSPQVRFPAQDKIIDQSDVNNVYIGIAKLSSATSSAVWQIQRLQTVAGVLSIQFANGTSKFDKIWDNRTTYTYS